jgi:RNA polymerase subunit RPABC4/transcription elongation factor Spt4
MIYFCQDCSAVLNHRVNYCPYCGRKQFYQDECEDCGAAITENDEYCPECDELIERDEDKTRYCPNCGYDLDTDGRDLNRKYCNGEDCGKEIGGLIRYSAKTGETLSVEDILKINDYKKEITDWISGIFGYNSFYQRMLYIYDKSKKFKGKDFLTEYSDYLEGINIYHIEDFKLLADENNYKKLMVENPFSSRPHKHCICVIDIDKFNENVEAHAIIEYCKDFYGLGAEYDYSDVVRKFDVSFVFVSSFLPEETKICNYNDKYCLLVSPEILRTLEIDEIWKEFMGKSNGKQ